MVDRHDRVRVPVWVRDDRDALDELTERAVERPDRFARSGVDEQDGPAARPGRDHRTVQL